MNIKTYIKEINTISSRTKYNTSQNPVCDLFFGDGFSRVLFKINLEKIRGVYNDELIKDTSSLKHTLKMTNTSGLQQIPTRHIISSGVVSLKERASIFKLKLYKITSDWSSGIGNDFSSDGLMLKDVNLSDKGVTWFNSETNKPWSTSGVIGDSLNAIAEQTFTSGSEDIEFDITDSINELIGGDEQFASYAICFDSNIENSYEGTPQYVGFFTSKSNTFFKPYIESTANVVIIDDRNHFYLDKVNRLYFYSIIGGKYTNLDQLPTCIIDGEQPQVKNPCRGVYYVELSLSSDEHDEECMYYDEWTNIKYNNKELKSVTLDFVTKSSQEYFNFTNTVENKRYIPQVYGINHGQDISNTEKLKLYVNPRVEYTTKQIDNITNMEYKLYVKEGNKKITVIDYTPINRTSNDNFFVLRTMDLLPNNYHIDIRISSFDEIILHENRFEFKVVNHS